MTLPARKPRPYRRDCFAGVLSAGRLTTRGCKSTYTDRKTGEFLHDTWNPRKSAWLNLGDRVIVANAIRAIDEVALCEVVGMHRDGSAQVAIRRGAVSDGRVHVAKPGDLEAEIRELTWGMRAWAEHLESAS